MAAHGVDFRLAGLLKGRFNEPGKFGRMFPHLRSLKPAQLAVSPEVLGAALLKDGGRWHRLRGNVNPCRLRRL